MDTAPKDVLSKFALELDLPDLLRWCQSNSRIYHKVCNNDDVWRSKLLKDYPEYDDSKFNLNLSPRETYVFMYQLAYIKKLSNTRGSLYDIFLSKIIDLSRKGLKKVPQFNIPNLQILYLSYNHLTKVPEFDLPNLQRLYLNNNKLTEVPQFNFPNLQILYLRDNQLTEVPQFNLPNLKELYLNDNQLKEVPYFNLPKLQKLYLDNNKLTEVPEFDLPNLQKLDLNNNKLTLKAKKALKKRYGNNIKL